MQKLCTTHPFSNNITVNISSDLIDKTECNTRTLWGLALKDGSDNTEAIGQKVGHTTDVQLGEHTLYRNGDKQTDILDITALIDYLTGHGLVKRVVSNVDLGLGH